MTEHQLRAGILYLERMIEHFDKRIAELSATKGKVIAGLQRMKSELTQQDIDIVCEPEDYRLRTLFTVKEEFELDLKAGRELLQEIRNEGGAK